MSSDDPFASPVLGGIPRFLLREDAGGTAPAHVREVRQTQQPQQQQPPQAPITGLDRTALQESDSGVATHTSDAGMAPRESLDDVSAVDDIVRDPVFGAPRPHGLFPGDTGQLLGETRRVLVQLLSGPSVDGRRQPQLWAVLLRDRRDVASRLNDLFLELVVDTDQQVAFVRQASGSDDDDLPILLRRQPLTLIESALVLHLRQRLTEADRIDERAVIGLQEMYDYLQVFEQASNNDGVKFDKKCATAVEKIKTLSLLRQIRGSEGRFEISPTLKLLFSAEEVIALGAAYEKLKDTRLTSGGARGDEASGKDVESSQGGRDADPDGEASAARDVLDQEDA